MKKIIFLVLLISLLTFISSSSARWNPYILGGLGGAAFKPTDVPGCVLWLESDTGITADHSPPQDGDKVSAWADQSITGTSATQGTSAYMPLFKTNQKNGYPSIRFDGSNDFLSTGAFTLHTADIYWVIKNIVYSQDHTFCDGLSDTMWVTQRPLDPYIRQLGGVYGNYTDIMPAGSWVLLQSKFAAGSSLLRVNGGTAVTSSLWAVYPDGLIIGSQSGGTWAANIEICGLIAYSAGISDSDRTKVQDYLNNKYIIY